MTVSALPVFARDRRGQWYLRCAMALVLLALGCGDANADSICARETENTIGVAEMQHDRTIVLMLRARDDDGSFQGEARLVYPPEHPQYDEILLHIGGIEPGETKSVPPWPTSDDSVLEDP